MHPRAKLQMHPLLPETEATLMFQQMIYIDAYTNFTSVTCSPHNAKTTIGHHQPTNWPIPIISQLLVHLHCGILKNIVLLQQITQKTTFYAYMLL